MVRWSLRASRVNRSEEITLEQFEAGLVQALDFRGADASRLRSCMRCWSKNRFARLFRMMNTARVCKNHRCAKAFWMRIEGAQPGTKRG